MRYQMNRTQYNKARRLIRDNGYYAFIWLTESEQKIFRELKRLQYQCADELKERFEIVTWCKRDGISYNFRQLARK